MEATSIWTETARRVALYQREQVQRAASRYPALFILAWLFKIALIDGPIAVVRWVRSLRKGRKQTGDLVRVGTERV